MRMEEIASKALERVNNDRYMLSNIIFARVEELSKGVKPLVDMNVKIHKLPDIALIEIAEGKIGVKESDGRDFKQSRVL
ncbi:DNA-directed RNA polymerase subunit omega [Helicobacter monodelphidis]|nr:DNA-directed RNA polymerase subunit omega [Helicobacter sp. 15-1451]